jgi:hypothetical protein
MRPQSAKMLSWQRQTGVLGTPELGAIDEPPVPDPASTLLQSFG